MTLDNYLALKGMTHAQFAALIGRHKSTVQRVVAGGSCSRKLAAVIERATGGGVTFAEVLVRPEDDATPNPLPGRAA